MNNLSAPSPDELKAANRRVSLEALEHLNALKANPHFEWFVENALEPARDRERDRALNISLPDQERRDAAQRHDLAKSLCGKLEELCAMHAVRLGIKLD